MQCEDLDWCQRFHQAGYRVRFTPLAKAVHHQGTSSKKRPWFVEYHKHRGMWRFYRKFQAADDGLPTNIVVALGIVARFLLVATKLALR